MAHEHTCIECGEDFQCDGDEDLNRHDVMVCDTWTATTALCAECDRYSPDAERERDAMAEDHYWQRKLDEARGK